MKVLETSQFRTSLNELPKPLKKKAEKQFKLFFKNMFHPSLHTEKLEPRQKNIWSFRVDKSARVIFTWGSDALILLDIGPHDIYRSH